MKQYKRLKDQHADAILLCRVGDFYEAFYDDAEFSHGSEPENFIEANDAALMVSTLLRLRRGTVVDEIRMTPAKSVIARRAN